MQQNCFGASCQHQSLVRSRHCMLAAKPKPKLNRLHYLTRNIIVYQNLFSQNCKKIVHALCSHNLSHSEHLPNIKDILQLFSDFQKIWSEPNHIFCHKPIPKLHDKISSNKTTIHFHIQSYIHLHHDCKLQTQNHNTSHVLETIQGIDWYSSNGCNRILLLNFKTLLRRQKLCSLNLLINPQKP